MPEGGALSAHVRWLRGLACHAPLRNQLEMQANATSESAQFVLNFEHVFSCRGFRARGGIECTQPHSSGWCGLGGARDCGCLCLVFKLTPASHWQCATSTSRGSSLSFLRLASHERL
eukprot:718123-Rhodomonas_salina.1